MSFRVAQVGQAIAIICLCLFSACVTGCGVSNSQPNRAVVPGVVSGRMVGGQQPVSGAAVTLYTVGTTADASAATQLTSTVITDANGGFQVTTPYVCPTPTSLVYALGVGGNPGLDASTDNTAIALMAVLGQCQTLSSSTAVTINEVTTVAAVAGLLPYIAGPTAVGSGANDAGGLASAFTLADEYANTTSGTVPGAGIPSGYTAPVQLINTLANILAACVNTAGGTAGDGTGCGGLFASANSGGVAPTDTVTALVDILTNPTANLSALFDLSTALSPFQSALASAPATWTVALVSDAPVANPGGPYRGTAGASVSFDGSGSYDPQGQALTYLWNFADGRTGTGAKVTHVFASATTYIVSLTVIDSSNLSTTATVPVVISTSPRPPVANAGGPYNGTAGVQLTFSGAASTDPQSEALTYAWSFGDGSTGTGATPSHIYAIAANYSVSLTVTDTGNLTSTVTTTATIAGQESGWTHPGIRVGAAQLQAAYAAYHNTASPYYSVIAGQVSIAESNYTHTQATAPLTTGTSAANSGLMSCTGTIVSSSGYNSTCVTTTTGAGSNHFAYYCGGSTNYYGACNNAGTDAISAYTQAVLWQITGNQTYANNAITILNQYANSFVGFAGFAPGPPCPDGNGSDNCSQAPLEGAWEAEKWTVAADIIRHGSVNGLSSGWSNTDAANFGNMLAEIYLPLFYNGAINGVPGYNNQGVSQIDAVMGIAVYNEDETLYRDARKMWLQMTASNIYNSAQDGSSPAPFPSFVADNATWDGQIVFGPSTNGAVTETCRDLNHTQYTLASTTYAAETDYLQGGSLYTDPAINAEARITGGLNTNAALGMLTAPCCSAAELVQAPANFCTGTDSSNINQIEITPDSTYIVGFNHYHNRLNASSMTANAETPITNPATVNLQDSSNTYNLIRTGVTNSGLFHPNQMIVYELLTHYAPASVPATTAVSVQPSSSTYTVAQGAAMPTFSAIASPAITFLSAPICSVYIQGTTVPVTTTAVPGTYEVWCTAAVAPGFKFTYTPATLTVTASSNEILVTGSDAARNYGGANPTFSYTLSPNAALTTKPTCTSIATSTSGSGQYPITCSGAALAGYTFVYAPGTLTISNEYSIITANNASMTQGTTVPTFTYSVSPSGLSFSTTPTCATTATSSSKAGSYPIQCWGAAANGYGFQYVSGVLTVN